jgi:high-affinity Fe2+/Pb2+ permease
MTPKTRRALRLIALICLIVAILLAVAIVAGMLYLQRGSYNPLDSLVLIAVCMMVAICPACLLTAIVLLVVQLIAGFISR